MPLILNRQRHDGTRFFVWKINESEDALLSLLSPRLCAVYRPQLAKYRSAKRRREWLAARVVLHRAAGIDAPVTYDAHGAPALDGCAYVLSVSHSAGVAFVALSKKRIGIDVQRYSPQLERVESAFLNTDEQTQMRTEAAELATTQTLGHTPDSDEFIRRRLLLVWGAKEAIFKLTGGKCPDLKNNVTVAACGTNKFGYTSAAVTCTNDSSSNTSVITADIRYLFADEYVFVVAE